MFNRLPGAMLTLGHTHQWKKGFNCCPVLSQDTSSAGRLVTATFNPAPPVAGLTSVSPPLTLRAIVRAALCDQCSPDGRPASHARLAGTLVNAVLELEKAAAAFGIHVVGNRGAAFLDGLR